jgi:Family of unknown function (DUF6152)
VTRWTWSLACALAVAVPVHAHHSIGSVYDSSRQATIEGVVTEFRFVNPHPFLMIDVATDAAPEPWQLEMDNRFELAEIGVEADTFKSGDRIVVTGSVGRANPRTLYVMRLDRPADGLRYEQIGTRPRINRT